MYKKFFLLFISVFIFLFINSCDEKINEPCGSDIKITFVAKYHECNEECINFAENALISVSSDNSTLGLSGNTNNFGKTTLVIPESGCGVSNLNLVASFRNRFISESYPYICSDTTIFICFDLCEPDTNQPRSCDDINQNDRRVFKDAKTNNDCISINSASSLEIVTYKANDNIIIRNLRRILNLGANEFILENAFRPQIESILENNGQGPDGILQAGSSISLGFKVKTDKIGQFTDFFEFQLVCAEEPSSQGLWRIDLEAEVCETPCDCPFNPNELKKVTYQELLKLGETAQLNNVNILNIDPTALSQDCYININEIVRIDNQKREYSTIGLNNNPYQFSNTSDLWRITSVVTYPKKLRVKEKLNLNFEVRSNITGFLRDTFRIKTTVHNSTGVIIDENCFFDFYLEARGCEDACAVLEVPVSSSNSYQVNEVNTRNLSDIWNLSQWSNPRLIRDSERVPLLNYYNNNELFYDITTMVAPDESCNSSLEWRPLTFRLLLPDINNSCELNQRYTLENINPYPVNQSQQYSADGQYFKYNPINPVNVSSNYVDITINYKPPTSNQYRELRSQFPNKSSIRFRLSIRDSEQSMNCHIVINVRIQLTDIPIPGPIRQLYAYSQITPEQPHPDYMAVRIDTLHPDGYWGVDKNQVNPRSGNFPISNESFFINVDNPNGLPGQLPLLNLVPRGTIFNSIARATNVPYSSQLDFENNYAELINNMFGTDNSFDLIPDRIASSFNGTNGISVQAGEVYAVWSSNNTYPPFQNPCHLALIYIYEVHNGVVPENQSNISNIRYRIVYPIYK